MFLRSLNIRIAALFTAVFIVASAMLFSILYLFQFNTLVRDDRRSLEARTLEFWATYQTGGAVAIQRALNIETFLTDYDPFLLRIASQNNTTLATYYPSTWTKYKISRLEEQVFLPKDGVRQIPAVEGNAYLDVITVTLVDRNLLQIAMSSEKRQTLLRRFRRLYLFAIFPIVILGFFAGIVFSTRMLKPVIRLINLTKRIIETGGMAERLPASGRGDELDELTELFNRMLGRVETLLDGMRNSLDNVAHDLRTPLTRLRHRLETAQVSDDKQEAIAIAVDETEAIQSMISTLMDISEAETGVMKLDISKTDISLLVEDITEFYGYLAEEKSITIVENLSPDTFAFIDIQRISQVLTNLLDNAVKYTPANGTITVSVEHTGSSINVSVGDTGSGIPENDLPHIWNRLFRGDKSRSEPGLGLGLGVVKAIVTAHGGSVDVKSEVGKGSVFTINLPARLS